MRAEAVGMTRHKTETFGAFIKTTFLLLVTLSSTEETGITVPGMRWGKDRVSLVVKSFYLVSPFLDFSSTLKGKSFLKGMRRRRARSGYDNRGWRGVPRRREGGNA